MPEDTRARHMRTAAEMASACWALAGQDTDRAVDLLADRVRAAPAIRQAICETFFRDNLLALLDDARGQIGTGRPDAEGGGQRDRDTHLAAAPADPMPAQPAPQETNCCVTPMIGPSPAAFMPEPETAEAPAATRYYPAPSLGASPPAPKKPVTVHEHRRAKPYEGTGPGPGARKLDLAAIAEAGSGTGLVRWLEYEIDGQQLGSMTGKEARDKAIKARDRRDRYSVLSEFLRRAAQGVPDHMRLRAVYHNRIDELAQFYQQAVEAARVLREREDAA